MINSARLYLVALTPRTYLAEDSQCGFTLLEMLVALVILSVGMLGIAGMQARGLRYNHEAYVRTQATFLANDLFERMRINVKNAASYVGDAPSNTCDSSKGAADVANDRACWHESIKKILPGGMATVQQSATNPNLYTVTIMWAARSSTVGTATDDMISQEWAAVIAN
jgi:type IV pilus assembly protein PilV